MDNYESIGKVGGVGGRVSDQGGRREGLRMGGGRDLRDVIAMILIYNFNKTIPITLY